MIVIIDTCSLLSLVRYYLPFDKDSILLSLIENKIKAGEIRIIDAVHQECTYTAQGIIKKLLPFLNDQIKTEDIFAPSPAKFLRQVDNQFAIGTMKNMLNPTEYEIQKERFLRSADMRLVLYTLSITQQDALFNDEVFIVTEETRTNNDNKLFKKLPSICTELNIKTLTLPEFLKTYGVIDIQFK